MAKPIIISVANEKGGVGKTTTARNTAAGLGQLGKKVLLVDLDNQENLTDYLGYDFDSFLVTVSDVIYTEVAHQGAYLWGVYPS